MCEFLTTKEISDLKGLHRKADKKQRDKIKAILLLNSGYDYSEIAEILIINHSTYEQFAVFRRYCLNIFRHLEKHRPELQTLMIDNFQLIQA